MITSQIKVPIITLVILTVTSAAHANKPTLEAQLERCPPIVFIKRLAQGRKGTDGETQSCIGCHESRSSAPPARPAALARLRREPDRITPPPWGAGAVDFVKHVQPVLNRYCIESQHAGVRMDDESRPRIYVWIVSNVPYYSTWDVSRPYTMGGQDTWARDKSVMASWYLDFEAVFEANCVSCHARGKKANKPNIDHTWINFTRPEFSRALNAHLSEQAGGTALATKESNQNSILFEDCRDPVYLAMLNAIRWGKKTFDARPRMDMPGATAIAQQPNFGKLY
ncbi:MAG: hypothetical protein JSW47_11380 [Phycisphaerales bacterium]|nr:MAG: hypothetical protein JSW47_11380 [Phycisphaerales bacterium]